MTIGEKIAQLRVQHHFTQNELAEKLGVSRQAISKWENGNSIPDLENLIAISELFETSLDALAKESPLISQHIPQKEMPAKSALTPRIIFAWILFGIGCLSMILGFCFLGGISVLGIYLLLCSLICFLSKKHPGLIIGWGTFLTVSFFLPYYTSTSMQTIFFPYAYSNGMWIQLIISWIMWIFLLLLIWRTIQTTPAKKLSGLFFAWALLVPNLRLIPLLKSTDFGSHYYYLSLLTLFYGVFLLCWTVYKLIRCFKKKKPEIK